MTTTSSRTVSTHAPVEGPAVRPTAPGHLLVAALVLKSLRDRWRSLMWWSIGLVGISAMQLAVYPSVQKDTAAFEQLAESFPEPLKVMFNMTDYTTGAGYLGVEMFSFMVPLALIAVAVAHGAGATAAEEEKGTADLLLTLPVRRVQVLLSKATGLLVAVSALAATTFVALAVGSRLVGLDISLGHLAAGVVETGLVAVLFGAVALLIGALTGSRGAALGGGIALALTAFLVQQLAPLASWLEPWRVASPWYWALGHEPLKTGMAWGWAGVLVTATVALVGLAVLAFDRRDVSS